MLLFLHYSVCSQSLSVEYHDFLLFNGGAAFGMAYSHVELTFNVGNSFEHCLLCGITNVE